MANINLPYYFLSLILLLIASNRLLHFAAAGTSSRLHAASASYSSPPAPRTVNLTHDDKWYDDPHCGHQSPTEKCASGFCCSEFGYCGKTPEYCGKNCQAGPCHGGDGGNEPNTPSPSSGTPAPTNY